MIAKFIGGPWDGYIRDIPHHEQLHVPRAYRISQPYFGAPAMPERTPVSVHVYTSLGPREFGGELYMYIGIK